MSLLLFSYFPTRSNSTHSSASTSLLTKDSCSTLLFMIRFSSPTSHKTYLADYYFNHNHSKEIAMAPLFFFMSMTKPYRPASLNFFYEVP
jgi:hypothetical protein